MKVTPFDRSRGRFLSPLKPGQGAFCLGSDDECSTMVEDGAVRLEWGSPIDHATAKKIRRLLLMPDVAQTVDHPAPSFLRKLPRLESLSVPLELLDRIDPETFPATLNLLMLNHTFAVEFELERRGRSPRWPERSFAGVRGLFLLRDANPWPRVALDPAQFPDLRFLHMHLGSPSLYDFVRGCSALQHLEVENANQKELASALPASVTVLSVVMGKFEAATFPCLPNLRSLTLKSVPKLDLEGLPALELEELRLLSAGRPKNVEALLESPTLRFLEVFGSDHSLTPAIRAKLKRKRFEQLRLL